MFIIVYTCVNFIINFSDGLRTSQPHQGMHFNSHQKKLKVVKKKKNDGVRNVDHT